MSIYESAVGRIDRGLEGLNVGLPMGFKRLTSIIPNIQQGTYYLIGGATGSGKTSFTDNSFLYAPFTHCAETNTLEDIEWIYYSFEIDKTIKIVKAITRELYERYGILTDVNYVLSRGKNRISQDVYDKVMELREYFELLESRMTIFDISKSPSDIRKHLHAHARDNGIIKYKKVSDGRGGYLKEFDSYIPTNPNKYTIVVIDHISLLESEDKMKTKELIDKVSQILVPVRNNYNYTPVVVQQLSFDSQTVQRRASKTVAPVLADFSDSKYTARDANVVMALFNPYEAEIDNYAGYDIMRLEDRFRSLEVLKNRDGGANLNVGLAYLGEIGKFSELPSPDFIQETHYSNVLGLKKKT